MNNVKECKELSTMKEIRRFFCCVFRRECKGIKWNEKIWKSWTMSAWWPEGRGDERDPEDVDHVCSGYFGHVWPDEFMQILAEKSEQTKLWEEIKAENLSDDEKENDDRYQQIANVYSCLHTPKDSSEIEHIFYDDSVCVYETYPFKIVKVMEKWVVSNGEGINLDHRGSRLGHFSLDLSRCDNDTVEIEPGVYEVDKLADILWRLKYNKFDNQYEMITGLDKDRSEIKDGTAYIQLYVDHGS